MGILIFGVTTRLKKKKKKDDDEDEEKMRNEHAWIWETVALLPSS